MTANASKRTTKDDVDLFKSIWGAEDPSLGLLRRIRQAVDDELRDAVNALVARVGEQARPGLEKHFVGSVKKAMESDLAKLASFCQASVFERIPPPPLRLSPEDAALSETIDVEILQLQHAVERARAEERVVEALLALHRRTSPCLERSALQLEQAAEGAKADRVDLVVREGKRLRSMDELLHSFSEKVSKEGYEGGALELEFARVRGDGSTTTRDLTEFAGRVR